MDNPKILVIDDEPELLAVIKDFLKERFQVTLANSGLEAMASLIEGKPDLILIDHIMPGINGIEVVKLLRRNPATRSLPIIMLTALKESGDRIEAFKAGVDDFISKPFHPDELMARIDAKLDRLGRRALTAIGNLRMDVENHSVEINSKRIKLTKIEAGILRVLIANLNSVVTRKNLILSVWPGPPPDERILDIHMTTLRKKIKHFDHQIETVYGKGYVIRGKQ